MVESSPAALPGEVAWEISNNPGRSPPAEGWTLGSGRTEVGETSCSLRPLWSLAMCPRH
jgi:hypothetical protein